MTEEDIIRAICKAIPLRCPRCKGVFQPHRIDYEGDSEDAWYIIALCEPCDQGVRMVLPFASRVVEDARFYVIGERGLSEEVALLENPEIPLNYKDRLPDLFPDIWKMEPEDKSGHTRTNA